jgi:rhamnulokinase
MSQTVRGLELGIERGPVASIGIDTWGVDYGLLDDAGELIAAPFSYRDARTSGWASLAERVGSRDLYRTTGIQLMGINTIFQLASHDRAELDRARRLLMLPELVVHALTGAELAERTSAGTSGLVDLATGSWSLDLLEACGVRPELFAPIDTATKPAGRWRGIPVHLVGGHDTASAVAALPGSRSPGAAFISSGTWMLVGAERDEPDTSDSALAANFSNEPAVLGGVRFLRNVMGLWMLEECFRGWGPSPGLLEAASRLPAGGRVVDATDERFLAPPDMVSVVRRAAGIGEREPNEVVARCVLDSLALAAARVLDQLAALTGRPVSEVHILGGGVRNGLLNRLIDEACGVPVLEGPAEATCIGNALVQGIAVERFVSLEDARGAL